MKSKSTKDNRYRHFNRQWFKDNQAILLWLLNAPMIRRWFSWILRIHKDRPFDKKIIAIEPHCYTWDNGKDLTTDFRTHNKFSKRIYFSFKYLWLTLHALDQILKPIPQFNFGFDTLTVYPDADAETTTVDGYVGYSGDEVSWATIISSAGNESYDSYGYIGIDITSGGDSGTWSHLTRSIVLFDTHTIGASSTITNAVLSVNPGLLLDDLSITPNINIYSSNPASNTAVVNADYSSLGSTEFSTSVAYGSFVIDEYTEFTFNASGKSAIDKESISKFGLRNASYDVANVAPSWSQYLETYVLFYSADNSMGDPKLVVTYTAGTVNNRVSNII